MDIDQHVYETIFKDEAEKIPEEILLEDEKEIVQKCIRQEELNDAEMTYLKSVLNKYREPIKKHNPQDIIEKVENTQRIIKSEKELLRLIDNQENYKLKMKYRVGENTVILSLMVKPLTDSQAIFEIEQHIGLYNVASNDEERNLINQMYDGETEFTEEEERLIKHITEKAMEKAQGDRNFFVKGWNEFLARQVEFENSELKTFGEKLAFWEKIDVSTKVSLYNKVREILLLDDTNTEDLFLDGR